MNFFKVARYSAGSLMLYLTLCYAEHSPATWQSVAIVLILSLVSLTLFTHSDII